MLCSNVGVQVAGVHEGVVALDAGGDGRVGLFRGQNI